MVLPPAMLYKLALLDWKPDIEFKDGLEESITWYQQNQSLWASQRWLRHIPIVTASVRGSTTEWLLIISRFFDMTLVKMSLNRSKPYSKAQFNHGLNCGPV